MGDPARTVLVVEPEEEVRHLLGRWLERRGHRVIECPGPGPPGFTCIGTERGRCPLVDGADVVLLDMWLPGEAVLLGSSSLDLLELYLAAGVPVVAFVHGSDPTELFLDERLTVMEWPPDRRELLETIHVLCPSQPPGVVPWRARYAAASARRATSSLDRMLET
jgi:CheY-like chemotaxis protein